MTTLLRRRLRRALAGLLLALALAACVPPPTAQPTAPPSPTPPATAAWVGDVNGDGLDDACWSSPLDNGKDGSFELLWDDGL